MRDRIPIRHTFINAHSSSRPQRDGPPSLLFGPAATTSGNPSTMHQQHNTNNTNNTTPTTPTTPLPPPLRERSRHPPQEQANMLFLAKDDSCIPAPT
ncbi:hypothetical protein CSOJ01_01596 [Colletotrichum sojae]|uniref:Uncharacterized protein n=1 Tax=Colletotrichum sojae TaxID=2175907 RepID=A0A8H6JTA3_9PEZI|nr:hypothetical protein CSOJ01_01596 [Colletotrichum sojae]